MVHGHDLYKVCTKSLLEGLLHDEVGAKFWSRRECHMERLLGHFSTLQWLYPGYNLSTLEGRSSIVTLSDEDWVEDHRGHSCAAEGSATCFKCWFASAYLDGALWLIANPSHKLFI